MHDAGPLREFSRSLAHAVISSSDAPLLLLDENLLIVAASRSFCRDFQIDPATVIDATMASLGHGEWNVPQLDALLQLTASGAAKVEHYEMDLRRGDQPTRRLVINAHLLDYAGDLLVRLMLSVADVTEERHREALHDNLLREKAVLLQELQHRVANSLQIIASVLMQSARRVQSEETRTHLIDAHSRLMSVATLQKQLAVKQVAEVELRTYFTDLCRSIGASMILDPGALVLKVAADDSVVSAETSVSLGLIVTELVINALKHGFPQTRGGRIDVTYRADGPDWVLSIGDNGVGMPDGREAAKAGLGTNIIRALAAQLQAEIEVVDMAPGTLVTIRHAVRKAADGLPQTKAVEPAV